MSMTESERARVHEISTILDELVALGGTPARSLISRLETLYGEQLIAAEERVLRICGGMLVERGLSDFWEQMYAAVQQDRAVQPGDAAR